ncbi:PAS domain S-box protein [Roseateles sp. GG27B]
MIVLLAGVAALTGWALDIAVLKSALPNFAAMKPNTALAFVAAGCALALHRHHGLRLGCAALVTLLGGLSLAQDLSGVDFGVDQLLFDEAASAAQTLRPGRMSPITAANLILLGGALALLGCRRAALHWVGEALALLALALALPALIGYVYGSESFYPLRGFGSMAPHAALVLPLLGLGILCARADGLAGTFIGPSLSGQVARRLLAMALIAPLLLGALLRFGEPSEIFDSTQNIAVFAAAMMMVLVLASARLVRALAMSDTQGRQALIARARLALIVECSDDAIISEAVDGTILSWNAGAERMYGYTAEEAVGRTGALLIPQERRQEEEEVLQRLRRGLAVGTYDTLRLTKAGQAIDVALTVSTLKDAAGQVVGTAKIMRGIGPRNLALLALNASEERLRLACSTPPKWASWTWQPSTDRIIWENQWPNTILGVASTAEPIGAACFAAEFVHPDDLAAFQQAITGTVERGERLLYEGRFYRPDGSLRWVEFTGRPQGGPNSPCERVIGTVRDITERKHAEEELRASEAFSRSILKSSPDCIKVLDLQGNLLSLLTGHKLLGIKNVEPYLLKSWLEFWTGEHRGMAQLAVEAAAAGRKFLRRFFCTPNA